MKWTGLNELRESFLSFFESKEHLRYPSASLVPKDDDSLLLINSGMAPLKNYFLGLEKPPRKRLTTCQKCIRTPDIEQVGKTSRHGTYFEMLGNFSFGDYFKRDATKWALEFLVDVLEIPMDKIWVTIYEKDDEAFEIWTEQNKFPAERIVRLGKEDNFWEIGSGPCGPCSEIYFDRGEEYTCDAPECGIGKCECDRYMEIWNLVFTQFNSDGKGNYTPLEHPNIDTGMGLERLACVMQGVDNLFEVDTVQNIMKHIASIADVSYGSDAKTDISLRVITDHIRSTVFMVGDGILPSNEGRGYVLRRLLRRAARHGRLLGINEPFLYKVCETVIEENKGVYTELEDNADYIKKIIRVEEERFGKTIEQGIEVLGSILDKLERMTVNNPIIRGEDAFRLYDTFGFPIDLTREIAEDRGVSVDEKGFIELMKEQRDRAREAHAKQGGIGWEEDVLAGLDIEDNFVGYTKTETDTKILAIIKDNEIVDNILEGQEAVLILEETPFYAESGGQVGDIGNVIDGDNVFEVVDCKHSPTGHILHIGRVGKGKIHNGENVKAVVNSMFRNDVMRNHTATHLLHAALRKVLGDHVHQAGSFVNDEVTRFDFTHFSAVTQEELSEIEEIVNFNILSGLDVTTEEMPIAEARKKGAMALFGDKYSEIVRVCKIEDKSMELCGGTHVKNTATIGLFKILSESSVAAGVRRIEATTGNGVLRLIKNQDSKINEIAETLKVNNPAEIVTRAKTLVSEISELEKEVSSLESKLTSQQVGNIEDMFVSVGSVKLGVLATSGSMSALQEKADELKNQYPNVVGVFVANEEDKATALVFAGKDAVKAGIHSGKLIKEITAIAGGNGGGRPDNAKGGLPEMDKIDNALAAVKDLVEQQLA